MKDRLFCVKTGWQIAGIVVLVLSLIMALYLTVMMIHRQSVTVDRGDNWTVFRYEMIICAFFIGLGLDMWFHFPGILGWIVRILLIAGIVVFLCLFIPICLAMRQQVKEDGPAVGNIVVLGMLLENGKPSQDLLYRIDTAADYARQHPETAVIVTGGNRKGDSLTEGEVMRELLLERGIAENRIIVEDQATDTEENFKNVARMTDSSVPILLVTNGYHMYRASGLAESVGFPSIQKLPARSELLSLPSNLMWETICTADLLIKGKIRIGGHGAISGR